MDSRLVPPAAGCVITGKLPTSAVSHSSIICKTRKMPAALHPSETGNKVKGDVTATALQKHNKRTLMLGK